MRRTHIHPWTRYGTGIAIYTGILLTCMVNPTYAQTNDTSSASTAENPQPTLTIKQRKRFTKDFVKDGEILGISAHFYENKKEALARSGNTKPMGAPSSTTRASSAKNTDPPTSTPLPNPTPTTQPTHTPAPTDGEPPPKPPSLDQERLFTMVNEHRASLEKHPYEKSEELCAIARDRGPELHDEIFVTGDIHGGFRERTKNTPYWITENMKYGGSLDEVLGWWLSSDLHRTAIESDQHTHACTECYGNTCIMLFTSFIPK